jgi:hypothetical protein
MTTVILKPASLRITAVVSEQPSDAELLATLGSLLAAVPGPFCGPQLSRLVSYVCATCAPAEPAEWRALRLERELADFLNDRHVLNTAQATPNGLDEWAAGAPIVFLRAAVIACARCQTAGGPR